MIIGGMQKLSLIDYPDKVSAVLFTRGCNFRCHYCHNPELVLPEFFQMSVSQDYVFEFLKSRKENLDGVVITGGEPAMHKDLLEFMEKIKSMGYMIKLDSCGIFPDVLKAAIDHKLVDYIAMDIKATPEKYDLVTGVSPYYNNIKKSIEIIINSDIDYEFRTTVVRSQLSPSDIVNIAKSISGAKHYILQKFVNSRTLDPDFDHQATYTDEELKAVRNDVKRYVSTCSIR